MTRKARETTELNEKPIIPIGFNLPSSGFHPHRALSQLQNQAEWVSLRYVEETSHNRQFRDGKVDETSVYFDRGVMVEVMVNGSIGYAGTGDLTDQGIHKAFSRAKELAVKASQYKLAHFTSDLRPEAKGTYRSPHYQAFDKASLVYLSELLAKASQKLKVSQKIASGIAVARLVETSFLYITSSGTEVDQKFSLISTHFGATARDGNQTQRRSDKGPVSRCIQAGAEVFEEEKILARCEQIGREAIELLTAENCPSDTRDLILAPDQMLLQIHESIGHPLELDRILGDERNYAGWSFVKPEDFGTLQYGSELMNVTFDPTVPGQFASYSFDDSGHKATREYLIKNGVLLRGLGGLESQARSGLPGVANFRASSWNRAPIDRMANINLEPGSSSLKEMIEQTEKGIYMESNISWSIDDYRNKFQFGCEYARLIEDGRLSRVVKNPNYRGMTIPFWRSLRAVGSADQVEMFGSPYCGKGEPNQIIRVGHASPNCLFKNIEVFGGGQ